MEVKLSIPSRQKLYGGHDRSRNHGSGFFTMASLLAPITDAHQENVEFEPIIGDAFEIITKDSHALELAGEKTTSG